MGCNCNKVYNAVESKIGNAFAAYGRFLARHPWKFIFFGILINGLLGIGMIRIDSVTDVETVYTPIGSQSSEDKAKVEQIFPDLSGTNFIGIQMPDLGRYGEVVVKPKQGDIFDTDFLNELKTFHSTLLSITTEDESGNTVPLSDICVKSFSNCAIDGDVFVDNEFSTAASSGPISYPYFVHSVRGPIYYEQLVGGVTVSGGAMQSATMLILRVNLRKDTEYYINTAKNWQNSFLTKMQDYKATHFDISYAHTDSLSEELDKNISGDIVFFSVTFTLMITYACMATMTARCDCVGQRSNLGFGGVLAAGLAIVSSFGIVSACGVQFVSIVGVVPFLIIGIGVDDMFLLMSGITETNYDDPVEKRIGETMRTSGVSITITSLTDLLAFAAGASSIFLSVRNFCIYSGIAVIFCYINQATIFMACIAINEYRTQDNLHFATCLPVRPTEELQNEEDEITYMLVKSTGPGKGVQGKDRDQMKTINFQNRTGIPCLLVKSTENIEIGNRGITHLEVKSTKFIEKKKKGSTYLLLKPENHETMNKGASYLLVKLADDQANMITGSINLLVKVADAEKEHKSQNEKNISQQINMTNDQTKVENTGSQSQSKEDNEKKAKEANCRLIMMAKDLEKWNTTQCFLEKLDEDLEGKLARTVYYLVKSTEADEKTPPTYPLENEEANYRLVKSAEPLKMWPDTYILAKSTDLKTETNGATNIQDKNAIQEQGRNTATKLKAKEGHQQGNNTATKLQAKEGHQQGSNTATKLQAKECQQQRSNTATYTEVKEEHQQGSNTSTFHQAKEGHKQGSNTVTYIEVKEENQQGSGKATKLQVEPVIIKGGNNLASHLLKMPAALRKVNNGTTCLELKTPDDLLRGHKGVTCLLLESATDLVKRINTVAYLPVESANREVSIGDTQPLTTSKDLVKSNEGVTCGCIIGDTHLVLKSTDLEKTNEGVQLKLSVSVESDREVTYLQLKSTDPVKLMTEPTFLELKLENVKRNNDGTYGIEVKSDDLKNDNGVIHLPLKSADLVKRDIRDIRRKALEQDEEKVTCLLVKLQKEKRGACYINCCSGTTPKNQGETESYLDRLPRWLIPKIVLQWPLKIMIALLFVAYLGVSIYGATQLKQGLVLKNLVARDSYYYQYREWLDTNFPLGTSVSFIFDTQMEYSNSNTQSDILSFIDGIKYESTIQDNFEINWLTDFKAYAGYDDSSEANFVSSLLAFLAVPANSRFENDVVINSAQDSITASRIHLMSESIKDSQEQGKLMLRMRELASAGSMSVFAFSPAFIYYEQYGVILSQTLQTVGIAVGMVSLVTIIFMPHPLLLVYVTVTVAMITTGIFGFLPFLDLTLSSITMIHVIMSIGFSVDFAAHICHGYMISKGETRDEKMKAGIIRSGAPVFHGAISSLLGVVILAFAKSYIFYSFFQVMSLVITFGILHALLLLPVILSVIGPSTSEDNSSDSSRVSPEAGIPANSSRVSLMGTDSTNTSRVSLEMGTHSTATCNTSHGNNTIKVYRA